MKMIKQSIIIMLVILLHSAVLEAAAEKKAGKMGKTVPELIQLLKSGKESLLGFYILDLGSSSDERAIQPLEEILLNKKYDAQTRAEAAQALGKIGNRLSIKSLKKIVKDKDEDKKVILFAIKALGEIKDRESINLLKEMVNTQDEYLDTIAAEALILAGEKQTGLTELRRLKTTIDLIQFLRRGIINFGECRDTLIYIAQNGKTDYYRALAAFTLSEFGEKDVSYQVSVRNLKSNDKETQNLSLLALGNIGNTEAIPIIINEYLKSQTISTSMKEKAQGVLYRIQNK